MDKICIFFLYYCDNSVCYRYGNDVKLGKFTKGLEMSVLNHRVRSFFYLSLLISQVSCQTTYKRQTTGKVPPYNNLAPLQKEGSKATEVDAINHKQIADLYQKLLDLSLSLQGQDKSLIEEIEIPAVKNSLSEAVLVLSQLRDLNDYLALQPQAKTEDLYSDNITNQNSLDTSAETPNENRKVETPTLENSMLAIQVKLPSTLVDNMFLRNATTYKMVKSILQRSSDSEEYRNSLNEVISREASNWAALVPGVFQQASEKPESSEEIADKKPSIEEDKEISFGPGDLEFADTVLMYSQKLADKGEYKKAISQIKRISAKDPAFTKASLSLKRLSNIAVLDLRQKAAQAFQSAMPIESATAQYSYLEQAKLYLEQALNDFPDAENRNTVEENLNIINKRLKQLEEKIEVEKQAEDKTNEDN